MEGRHDRPRNGRDLVCKRWECGNIAYEDIGRRLSLAISGGAIAGKSRPAKDGWRNPFDVHFRLNAQHALLWDLPSAGRM